MVKKKDTAAVEATEEQQRALQESERLLQHAYDVGVLSATRRVCTQELKPSKALLKCNQKDIVKKSSTRKNRYLLVFNGLIAPVAGGKLGTLAQLDSKNPVCYVDMPSGRIKMCGTIVAPKNKYMVLKLGSRDSVLCEDVFDHMIVFSESYWIGTAEENPDEKRLPYPPQLQQGAQHSGYTFNRGAGESSSPAAAGAADACGTAAATPQQRHSEDIMADGGHHSGTPTDEATPLGLRSSTRKQTKRVRYAEDSDADSDDDVSAVDDVSDDDDDVSADSNRRRSTKRVSEHDGTEEKPCSTAKRHGNAVVAQHGDVTSQQGDVTAQRDEVSAPRRRQTSLLGFMSKTTSGAQNGQHDQHAKTKRGKRVRKSVSTTSHDDDDDDKDDGSCEVVDDDADDHEGQKDDVISLGDSPSVDHGDKVKQPMSNAKAARSAQKPSTTTKPRGGKQPTTARRKSAPAAAAGASKRRRAQAAAASDDSDGEGLAISIASDGDDDDGGGAAGRRAPTGRRAKAGAKATTANKAAEKKPESDDGAGSESDGGDEDSFDADMEVDDASDADFSP